MSAERYEIVDDGHLTIAIKHGANTLYIDELEDEFAVGAIRQQARDLDQLRADLAAAVSENAALLAANRDCILHFDAIKADYDAMKLRAEQAEARLAAIDAAPTVATVCIVPSTQRVYVSIDVEQYDLPPVGTHLIARPAKD